MKYLAQIWINRYPVARGYFKACLPWEMLQRIYKLRRYPLEGYGAEPHSSRKARE